MEWPRAPAAVVSCREVTPGALWAGAKAAICPVTLLLSPQRRADRRPAANRAVEFAIGMAATLDRGLLTDA